MSGPTYFPYCGRAPLPDNWLGAWNFDGFLLLSMAALLTLHLTVLVRTGELHGKRYWLLAAWGMLAALFISPLCALSSALYSVRVAHHVVLIGLVAPALVMSLPDKWRSAASYKAGGIILIVNIAIVWLWHAPAPYAAAMSSDMLFWAMQLSLLLPALVLWHAVLAPAAPFGTSLTLLLGMVLQMGLLGALITFARTPLYAPHFGTAEPFGLATMADQQLAGLIMWVPANLPYLVAALLLVGRGLAGTDAVRRSP